MDGLSCQDVSETRRRRKKMLIMSQLFLLRHRKAPFPCISPPFSLAAADPGAILLLSNRIERVRCHSCSHRRAKPPRQPARGTGNEVCLGCIPAANRLVKLLLQLPLLPRSVGPARGCSPGSRGKGEKKNNKTKRGGFVVVVVVFFGVFLCVCFLLGPDLKTPLASPRCRAGPVG